MRSISMMSTPTFTGPAAGEVLLEQRGEMAERRDDDVGRRVRRLERLGAELPGSHERGLHPEELRAAHVRLDVVRDEPRQLGLGGERVERRGEVGRARLPEHDGVDPGRVLEPRDERARVEHRATARLPPLVLVQAVQRRAHLDLVERTREVHVAEDLVRLERLVAAADQHGLRVIADELEAVEIGNDVGHHEREDALAGELTRGCPWRRLDLLVLEREAHVAKLFCEAGSRPGRVVRDEPESVARATELRDGVRGARDRISGDVQHAVDVEQNARHGA